MQRFTSRRSPKISQLVGRWRAIDPWETDVSLIVSNRGGKIRVRAVDDSDGEEAEIFGLKVTTQKISFAAYWSTGQLTKYSLRALFEGQMEVTYTFTAKNTFQKVAAKPKV